MDEQTDRKTEKERGFTYMCVEERECVCVFVTQREREREREREECECVCICKTHIHTHSHTQRERFVNTILFLIISKGAGGYLI